LNIVAALVDAIGQSIAWFAFQTFKSTSQSQ